MTKKQGKHWVMITLNRCPRIGFAGASQEIQWETGTSDSSSRPWPPWGHRCACIVAALTVELTQHLKICRSSMSICLILWTYLEDPIGYPVTLWGGGARGICILRDKKRPASRDLSHILLPGRKSVCILCLERTRLSSLLTTVSSSKAKTYYNTIVTTAPGTLFTNIYLASPWCVGHWDSLVDKTETGK